MISQVRVCLLLPLIGAVLPNLAKATASELVGGCSSHCTLDFDKDLSCWNKTLNYYNHILMGQMRQYVTTQIHIAIWKHDNGRHIDWDSMVNSTVDHMKKIPAKNIEDEDGLIQIIDFTNIIKVLVERIKRKVTEYLTASHPIQPSSEIDCPFGCEHGWDPFFWMFLGSGFVNIVLAAVSVYLVWRLDRRDTIQANLELAECEVVNTQKNLDDTGIGALKRKSVHSMR